MSIVCPQIWDPLRFSQVRQSSGCMARGRIPRNRTLSDWKEIILFMLPKKTIIFKRNQPGIWRENPLR